MIWKERECARLARYEEAVAEVWRNRRSCCARGRLRQALCRAAITTDPHSMTRPKTSQSHSRVIAGPLNEGGSEASMAGGKVSLFFFSLQRIPWIN